MSSFPHISFFPVPSVSRSVISYLLRPRPSKTCSRLWLHPITHTVSLLVFRAPNLPTCATFFHRNRKYQWNKQNLFFLILFNYQFPFFFIIIKQYFVSTLQVPKIILLSLLLKFFKVSNYFHSFIHCSIQSLQCQTLSLVSRTAFLQAFF